MSMAQLDEYRKRFRSWLGTKEGRWVSSVLLLAFILRLPIARFPGFFNDLQTYVDWGALLSHHLRSFYAFDKTANYPPLTIYLFWLVDAVYKSGSHLLGLGSTLVVSRSWRFAIFAKMPAMLSDIGISGALFWLGRQAGSWQRGLAVAAAYAFSPAVIFNSTVWGQTDAIFSFCVLLAIVAALNNRSIAAGICFGLALMLKPQPIVFGPLILIYLWRWSGSKEATKAVIAFAATCIVICLPYLIPPHPGIFAFLQDVEHVFTLAPIASPSGYNFWWMIGDQTTSLSQSVLGPLTPQTLGWGLMIVGEIIAGIAVWRDRSPLTMMLSTALIALAFFLFTPLQHERYIYPVLFPLLGAALYAASLWWMYALATITAFLNMGIVVIVRFHYGPTLTAIGAYVHTHTWVAQTIGALNVFLGCALVAVLWLQRRQPVPAATVAVVGIGSIPVSSIINTSEEHNMLTTARLVAIRPMPDTTLPRDSDSSFWIALRGGIAALSDRCLWLASDRLQWLIGTYLIPMTAQAQGWDALSLATPDWQTTIAHWQPSANDFAPLRQAYQQVSADYQSLRALLALPVSSDPSPERDALAALDVGARQQSDDFSSVLTWQTVSIVLPAYNEELVIAQTIQDCLRAVRQLCPNAEIIVVDDGSRDNTGAIADSWAARDARVVVVHNRPNKGYGGALLAGFAAARGSWVFFMDSDGQFDIRQIADLWKVSLSHPGAAVLGYRAHRSDPLVRRLNAWGWKRLVGIVVGLHGIRDIDCAFKLLPGQALRACGMQSQSAMVNTEMLVKMQKMHVPMEQVPVSHFPRTRGTATGANLKVILRAFQELLRLRGRLRSWQPTQT